MREGREKVKWKVEGRGRGRGEGGGKGEYSGNVSRSTDTPEICTPILYQTHLLDSPDEASFT